MKTYTLLLGLTLLFISCGEAPKKDTAQQGEKSTEKKDDVTESLPSADYSSLLIDYTCGMDAAELAKAMKVPESNLSIPDYAKKPSFAETGNCYFSLKGFGTGAGGDTGISMGTTKMTKVDIKNEINGYLKRKKDGLEKITKMYIVEADTKDSYIATQLRQGRVIILNENYDNAFLIAYGTRNAATDRTQEQHEALTQKMVGLANYLLKKHRK
ncbi:hypothetical protein [Flagellimonas sp. CMM7]|uniref:hypothetical protein n=1 Tax=Flagellimonas sp. CMM7 TaxID=2654676 RepID=UPI0013D71D46|nr:hypothetical protein [Flagellimonas sp. CMM7]UII78409.1 hypothetical protein LV704_12090 [Flagellimonas sp. CMM7]